MCPLRVVLIFLSATLAGFLLLRGLRTNPEDDGDVPTTGPDSEPAADSTTSKFRSSLSKGFWTCIDMASGRYLWRNLVTSSACSSATAAATSVGSDDFAASKKSQ